VGGGGGGVDGDGDDDEGMGDGSSMRSSYGCNGVFTSRCQSRWASTSSAKDDGNTTSSSSPGYRSLVPVKSLADAAAAVVAACATAGAGVGRCDNGGSGAFT